MVLYFKREALLRNTETEIKSSQIYLRETSRVESNIHIVLVAQSHPTLCDPMDVAPQVPLSKGFPRPRILEWVAIPFSRGSSPPGIKPGPSALQADSILSEPPGKP